MKRYSDLLGLYQHTYLIRGGLKTKQPRKASVASLSLTFRVNQSHFQYLESRVANSSRILTFPAEQIKKKKAVVASSATERKPIVLTIGLRGCIMRVAQVGARVHSACQRRCSACFFDIRYANIARTALTSVTLCCLMAEHN